MSFRYCWFIGSCNHGNLGDHQIAESIKEFISDINPSVRIQEIPLSQYYDQKPFLEQMVHAEDALIFAGGGFLGNLWPRGDEVRRDAFKTWPDNIKIVFPQGIFFSNDAAGAALLEESCLLYKGDSTILALRDSISYQFAKEQFPCKLFLSPDIALYSKKPCEAYRQRKGALLILRSDKESAMSDENLRMIKGTTESFFDTVDELSTVSPHTITLGRRKHALDDLFAKISDSELVITDRLHGMIFSAISGTPCLVFNNNYHKISSAMEWVKDLPYIRLVPSAEQFLSILQTFDYKQDYSYPLNEKRALFSKFKRAVCDSLYIAPNDSASPKISVIIPAYNTAKYLPECLNSVLNQTKKAFEIICIDDGSSDETPEVLKQFATYDSRIRIISQENGGLSKARNVGISVAKGTFLLFLDSDDFLEQTALEILSKETATLNTDMLFFGMSAFADVSKALDELVDNYNTYYRWNAHYSGLYSGAHLLDLFVANNDYKPSACKYLLRKSFLQETNVRFLNGILYEDNAFTFCLLRQAKRAAVLEDTLYQRRIHKNSIMTAQKTAFHAYSYYAVARNMTEFALGQGDKNMTLPNSQSVLIERCKLAAYEVWQSLSVNEQEQICRYVDKTTFYQTIYSFGENQEKIRYLRDKKKSLEEDAAILKKSLREKSSEIKELRLCKKRIENNLQTLKNSTAFRFGNFFAEKYRRFRALFRR